VCQLFSDLYPDASTAPIERAFADATDLFLGRYPGYLPCETPYHDLQHSLDVSLAMARVLYGHEKTPGQPRLGADYGQLGIITTLFHDAGYMRHIERDIYIHGAAYTRSHVSRSAHFLSDYLPALDMHILVPHASRLVHYTGYEIKVHDIPAESPAEQMLGCLIGTADLLAQMADRCYLEKCRDRLYYEFAVAGIAGPDLPGALFRSSEEMIEKTPSFIAHAIRDRLNDSLRGAHRYSELFFLPDENLYWQAIHNNLEHLEAAIARNEPPLLRRIPPWTLSIEPHELRPDFPFRP